LATLLLRDITRRRRKKGKEEREKKAKGMSMTGLRSAGICGGRWWKWMRRWWE